MTNDLQHEGAEADAGVVIGLSENLMTLTDATKFLSHAIGRRPAVSTVWRWCHEGSNGVHLEYLRIGRKVMTSAQALDRFCRAGAQADREACPRAPAGLAVASSPRTQRARQLAIAAAERRLQEAGI